MGLQKAELSILLLDDCSIAELNQRYLHRCGPTDVISFPMHAKDIPQIQPSLLGDIVISVETALRSAQQRAKPLEEVVAHLLIHGILHLIGYDHEASPREALRMRRREHALLKKIKPHYMPSPKALP